MSITNITDKERALSAEVQQLKEELFEQARIVGMSTDREYALMGKLARQEKVLKLTMEALETCVCAMQDYQAGIGITEMFDRGERMGRETLIAIREALAEQPAQSEFECPRCGHCCPEQRKPLTVEEVWDAYMEISADFDCDLIDLAEFARAIEAAHGIK